MTEFDGLYTAVTEQGPDEIKEHLNNVPDIHRQDALDNALVRSITLTPTPKTDNVQYLLKLGANPNGPGEDAGLILSYAYNMGLEDIIELLLQAGADVNASHSDVLEQAVRRGDFKYVKRFVEAGGDINDGGHFLYTDDLLRITNDPEIRGYLIEKGINSPGSKLKDPLVTPSDVKITELGRHILVTGDTKDHQDTLRKLGGRFVKGKGWVLPKSKKITLDEQLHPVKQTATPSPPPTPEKDPEIEKMLTKITIIRPLVTRDKIILCSPMGEFGYMTLAYTQPNLFRLDSKMWDSVERYLMYKMYQGTAKADAILKAESLNDARRKFNVKKIVTAKTPKQLIINQQLSPLAESSPNKNYLNNKEHFFYLANKAKFSQNNLLKERLLRTGSRRIINKNSDDPFGYEGNMLGNISAKIRHELGGPELEIQKENNLVLTSYSKDSHVIRGDPTPELAAEIRGLGTYKAKNGKTIRGKLNLNLTGGPGWLIPDSNLLAAKDLVFSTLPDDKKIRVYGKNWIKKHIRKFITVATMFSQLRGRQEVGSDDVMFALKNVYGAEEFLGGDNGEPANSFVRSVHRFADNNDIIISDAAVKLLWDFTSKMTHELTNGIETFVQMKKIIEKLEAVIFDTDIKPIEGLTDRETVVISSFVRLYKLLKKVHDNESKVCTTAVNIMVGSDHYQQIRSIYSSKAKLTGISNRDEETQFRKRFQIKNSHIEAVLKSLPSVSKKCKLLLFTALDYIMDLDSDQASEINEQLITLSQRGSQPSPSPENSEETIKTEENDHPQEPETDHPQEPETDHPQEPENV